MSSIHGRYRRGGAALLGLILFACDDGPTAPAATEILIAAGDQQVGPAGTVLPRQLTVRVMQGGLPVPGAAVSWVAEETGGLVSAAMTPSLTDASGFARVRRILGDHAGIHSTTASVDGADAAVVRFTSIAQVQGAVRIAPHPEDDGNHQVDTVRATLRPYRVVATDHRGEPVEGVVVDWSTGTTSTTDANGLAQLTHTLGSDTGEQIVRAQVPGVIDSPITFHATAHAGNPVAIRSIDGDDQLGFVSTALRSYRVEANDAYGNPVSGVSIDWAITAGVGSIDPLQSVTAAHPDDVEERHVFAATVHILGPLEDTHVVTATASSIPGAPQTTFRAVAVTAIVEVQGANYWGCFYYGVCTGAFQPANVTVPARHTVGWVWRGDRCNVVFEDDPSAPASAPLREAGNHVRTFTTAGSYRYRCTLFSSSFTSGMVGVVNVR